MPEKIKVLIVEDTPTDIQIYEDAINEVNKILNGSYEIEALYQTTREKGLEELERSKDELDAAFIDLKLQTGEAVENNEGNDIVDKIYGKLRFPIFVMTNTPGAFDGKFRQSLFLQVLTKTDVEFIDVFMGLVGIYKTGINDILGRKGLIEKMLDDIFWKNISTTLPEWVDIENCQKSLLRYTLTHLQEHLEISDDGKEFDVVYPIENYIKPSIKRYFYTGDIVNRKDNKDCRFIILTPACDLAPHGEKNAPKATHVVLVEIENYKDTPLGSQIKRAMKQTKSAEDELAKSKAEEAIAKTIANDGSPKYYYLPDTSIIKGGLINFQKISTVKISELEHYEKEATITSQFVKDIIAKFSFYYSRQGSPDFDFLQLLKKHLS